MDNKLRRYQVACKLLNITEGKPITRKPRNPARGFSILKGLESKGWHLSPDEIVAFGKHYEAMNKARKVYGDKPFSPPANVQGWHNVLVSWRYSESYAQYASTIAPVVIESEDNKQPFSKEKMETIMKLMVEGFRSNNRSDRQSKIDEIQEVLNDENTTR